MITITMNEVSPWLSQSTEGRPNRFSPALTGPVCGATSNKRVNRRATATVGSTVGKKMIARIVADDRRSTKT
jgi:hypothetical protein